MLCYWPILPICLFRLLLSAPDLSNDMAPNMRGQGRSLSLVSLSPYTRWQADNFIWLTGLPISRIHCIRYIIPVSLLSLALAGFIKVDLRRLYSSSYIGQGVFVTQSNAALISVVSAPYHQRNSSLLADAKVHMSRTAPGATSVSDCLLE